MNTNERALFDHSKLEGDMREKRITHQTMSEKIGISRVSFEKKIKGESAFKDFEMERIIKALDKDLSFIEVYFFRPSTSQNANF